MSCHGVYVVYKFYNYKHITYLLKSYRGLTFTVQGLKEVREPGLMNDSSYTVRFIGKSYIGLYY